MVPCHSSVIVYYFFVALEESRGQTEVYKDEILTILLINAFQTDV